jgi:hypothetical protein
LPAGLRLPAGDGVPVSQSEPDPVLPEVKRDTVKG